MRNDWDGDYRKACARRRSWNRSSGGCVSSSGAYSLVESRLEARQSSVMEGVDGAVCTRTGDGRNRVSGQELVPEEERTHADLGKEGKLRELAAWKKFDIF